MPNELGLAVRAAQRTHQSIDAVARVAVDAMHAPLGEALDDEVANQCRHFDSVRLRANTDGARLAVKQR